jgi:NAD(P)H-flavin reductase
MPLDPDRLDPRDPMVPTPYRIVRRRRETKDVFTLELAPPDGVAPMAFAPGQFNMLYVFGVGESAISISGDPSKAGPLVHTVRAVGSVTNAMAGLRAGDAIGVRGPYGTPWPVDEAVGQDVVVVAGGIGLAPLRPVLYHVLANRAAYGSVALLLGARGPDELLFMREIERWRSRFDVDVRVTVDRSTPEWRGNVGMVTTLIPKARFDPVNAVAMVCGPEVMMRFTAAELRRRGMGSDAVYLTMERNMKCAVGFCGHCQFGPAFVCKDGPVFRSDAVAEWLARRDV